MLLIANKVVCTNELLVDVINILINSVNVDAQYTYYYISLLKSCMLAKAVNASTFILLSYDFNCYIKSPIRVG